MLIQLLTVRVANGLVVHVFDILSEKLGLGLRGCKVCRVRRQRSVSVAPARKKTRNVDLVLVIGTFIADRDLSSKFN